MEYLEANGERYEISGYAEDGLPIIRAAATTVHHTDEAGNLMYDADGNPVRSVRVNVPSAPIGIVPGEVT